MTRLLPLCALAAIGIAGCTTYYEPPPVAIRTTPNSSVPAQAASSAWKSGAGVIETISLGAQKTEESASAGGTAPSAVTGMGPYRMTLRMDDGSIQTLNVDNRAFLVGDRVQVSPEGRMIRQQ